MGAPKSVKSTECEPSMWEHVDEMNIMVGSSRTPTMARKVECDNKKKKKWSLYNGSLYGWNSQWIVRIHFGHYWCPNIWKLWLQGNCKCARLGSKVLVSHSQRFVSRTSNMALCLCSIIWLTRDIDGINNFFVCRMRFNTLWEVDDHSQHGLCHC